MLVELVPTIIPAPKGPPRSEGVHVSRIIRAIAVENGVLDPKWVDDLSLVEAGNQGWWESLDESTQLRMAMGLAWEEWYLAQLEHVAFHPGEMKVDGIYMTHDGESLDVIVSAKSELVLCLHEVKLTYKSLKTIGNLETQWMWVAQTKSYCKGLHTLVAYLHVLAVCGDYSYPMKPKKRIFKITYTQPEIDDNWELIVGYMHHHQQQEHEDLMRDTE